MANWIRGFSSREGELPPVRNVEDAPPAMRQELIDLFFGLVERSPSNLMDDARLYRVIGQCLGVGASGNPYAGYRYAAGRDIRNVSWPRVYDMILRLWPDFCSAGLSCEFQEGVNRICAGYGIAWELESSGRLHRVLPVSAQAQIEATIVELSLPRFMPALILFNSARDAYDDRPRRDRDACANVFDAMESVAKEKYGMSNATFGQVLGHIRGSQSLNLEIISVLEALNTLRNRNFGHGMTTPFSLPPAAVDFVYLTCIGAILMFVRIL